MLAYDKALEVEKFLKAVMPKDHTIMLEAAQQKTNWREREFRLLPPDPSHEELESEVTYYVFVARRPEGLLSIRVTVDAVTHQTPEAIWEPLGPLFPLPENRAAEVIVVGVGNRAALL